MGFRGDARARASSFTCRCSGLSELKGSEEMATRFPGIGVCVLGLFVTGSAHAELDLAFDGMHLHERVTRSYVIGDAWDAPHREGGIGTMSGVLSFNGGDLLTLCIELKQPASSNYAQYESLSFSEFDSQIFDRSRVLSSLFDRYWDQVISSNSGAMASAFAMMTWEIMLEGFSFTPGDMLEQVSIDKGAVQFSDVSATALMHYSQMVDSLYYASSSDNLLAYTHPHLQDQVNMIPSTSVLALFGLAGMKRRRRRA